MIDAQGSRVCCGKGRPRDGRSSAKGSGGAFAVTALGARAETGGFALAAEDAALAACLDRHIAWLTGGGRIGVREWLEDPSVFMRRVRQAAAEL